MLKRPAGITIIAGQPLHSLNSAPDCGPSAFPCPTARASHAARPAARAAPRAHSLKHRALSAPTVPLTILAAHQDADRGYRPRPPKLNLICYWRSGDPQSRYIMAALPRETPIG
jgi:hypothetical protein